jgi:2-haloacid dehalogenase
MTPERRLGLDRLRGLAGPVSWVDGESFLPPTCRSGDADPQTNLRIRAVPQQPPIRYRSRMDTTDPTTLDYGPFEALTFDCYGTLIDWEAGILAALRPMLRRAQPEPEAEAVLERYAAIEAHLEADAYRPYREILSTAAREVGAAYGVQVSDAEATTFGGSVADWPAFADSQAALQRLATRFRLGVITNCDDDLFAASNRRLGVSFDWVVTAQQARSYKPSAHNFEVAFERIGLPRQRILHVAQSLFHDHVTAKALGLSTVWIDRRRDRPGSGATPPAAATPDATYPDMASFASATVS